MISKYRTLFLIINAALTDISVVVDDTLDYAEIFEVGKKHQIIPLVYFLSSI